MTHSHIHLVTETPSFRVQLTSQHCCCKVSLPMLMASCHGLPAERKSSLNFIPERNPAQVSLGYAWETIVCATMFSLTMSESRSVYKFSQLQNAKAGWKFYRHREGQDANIDSIYFQTLSTGGHFCVTFHCTHENWPIRMAYKCMKRSDCWVQSPIIIKRRKMCVLRQSSEIHSTIWKALLIKYTGTLTVTLTPALQRVRPPSP